MGTSSLVRALIAALLVTAAADSATYRSSEEQLHASPRCQLSEFDLNKLAAPTTSDYSSASFFSKAYTYRLNICEQLHFDSGYCTAGTMVCEVFNGATGKVNYGYLNTLQVKETNYQTPLSNNDTVAIATLQGDECTYADDGHLSRTTINFKCDTKASKTYVQTVSDSSLDCVVEFNVYSDYLCGDQPANGNGTSTRQKQDDVGTILLLCFFIPLICYFIIGAVLLYRDGKRGTELIVHKTFWCSFPPLIKDGFRLSWWWCRCLVAHCRKENIPDKPAFPSPNSYQAI